MALFLQIETDVELILAFNEIDRDKDGMLCKKDIFNLVRKQLPKEEARNKTKSIFLNIDTSKKGKITFSDFIAANIPHEQLFSEINLKAAFDKIDRRQKGFID